MQKAMAALCTPEGQGQMRELVDFYMANARILREACAAQGAELAFTFQGEALEKRVRPLAASIGHEFLVPCACGVDLHLQAIELHLILCHTRLERRNPEHREEHDDERRSKDGGDPTPLRDGAQTGRRLGTLAASRVRRP